MGDDSQKQERRKPREALQIDLTKILMHEDKQPIRSLGVDLSEHGLGIVGFVDLPVDAVIFLQMNEKTIKLKVVWSRPDSVREGIFHTGLTAVDTKVNLAGEFKKAGLLTKVEQWSFPTLGKKKP